MRARRPRSAGPRPRSAHAYYYRGRELTEYGAKAYAGRGAPFSVEEMEAHRGRPRLKGYKSQPYIPSPPTDKDWATASQIAFRWYSPSEMAAGQGGFRNSAGKLTSKYLQADFDRAMYMGQHPLPFVANSTYRLDTCRQPEREIVIPRRRPQSAPPKRSH